MVYSTDPDYKYDTGTQEEPATLPPSQQSLRVWIDRRQRAGKCVTIVRGFVGRGEDLEELARMLKNRCGTGGTGNGLSANHHLYAGHRGRSKPARCWLVLRGAGRRHCVDRCESAEGWTIPCADETPL